ncbi:tetratricopeptide repeat protein [Glycomyces paridis]|uniref:tetratricopeptide repeat protein n=1 Tax=Glycomyces paridis TaxID=2126555 RepID=UPI00130519AD|nr:hypothetical protein [Glycomyces paridis]
MALAPLPLLRRLARRVPAPLKREPAATAAGNASFLGIGYLVVGRPGLAAIAAGGSVVLTLILANAEQPAWGWRIALLVWWLATVLHGWYLGGHRTDWRLDPAPPLGRRPRAVGLASGAAVLLVLVLVALSARWTGYTLTRAHEDGDCERVGAIADSLGPQHAVVDGLTVVAGEKQVDACTYVLAALANESDPEAAVAELDEYLEHPEARWDGAAGLRADLLLEQAAASLETANTQGSTPLRIAFDHIEDAIEGAADRADDAEDLMAEFSTGLAASADPCSLMSFADWIDTNEKRAEAYPVFTETVANLAPDATFTCAETLLAASNWDPAAEAFGRFATEYPDDERAADAKAGEEMANVRPLLDGWPEAEDADPQYCDSPAPLSAAPAYSGSGPHPMALFGFDRADAFPPSWFASDITDAVLVVCVGEVEEGADVGSCIYEGGVEVEFYTKQYAVAAIEVHTGTVVFEGNVQVGGDCPEILYYFGDPPERRAVESSDSDYRDAFGSLVDP